MDCLVEFENCLLENDGCLTDDLSCCCEFCCDCKLLEPAWVAGREIKLTFTGGVTGIAILVTEPCDNIIPFCFPIKCLEWCRSGQEQLDSQCYIINEITLVCPHPDDGGGSPRLIFASIFAGCRAVGDEDGRWGCGIVQSPSNEVCDNDNDTWSATYNFDEIEDVPTGCDQCDGPITVEAELLP